MVLLFSRKMIKYIPSIGRKSQANAYFSIIKSDDNENTITFLITQNLRETIQALFHNQACSVGGGQRVTPLPEFFFFFSPTRKYMKTNLKTTAFIHLNIITP